MNIYVKHALLRVKALKKLLNLLRKFLLNEDNTRKKEICYHKISYSQEGEDIILDRIFDNVENGFYVDIGAHHPKRFSNTYYFYLKGWRGINIDAMPGSMEEFSKIRPLDVNLELAISDTHERLTYYCFNEPALNTFSSGLVEEYSSIEHYSVVSSRLIETVTLSEVLDSYLPKDKIIDFMSIDVEGLDLNVLRSNNWFLYKPKVILIEDLNDSDIQEVMHSDIVSFLECYSYKLYCKTVCTLIFRVEQKKS